MKILAAVTMSLALASCASTRPTDAAMTQEECRSRVEALQVKAAAAWAEAEPAQKVASENPESADAEAAADAAMQKASGIAVDSAQAAADLSIGPCSGKL